MYPFCYPLSNLSKLISYINKRNIYIKIIMFIKFIYYCGFLYKWRKFICLYKPKDVDNSVSNFVNESEYF